VAPLLSLRTENWNQGSTRSRTPEERPTSTSECTPGIYVIVPPKASERGGDAHTAANSHRDTNHGQELITLTPRLSRNIHMPTYRRLTVTYPFHLLRHGHATSLITSSTPNLAYTSVQALHILSAREPTENRRRGAGRTCSRLIFQAHLHLLQTWVAAGQTKTLMTQPRPQPCQAGAALIPVTPRTHLDASMHQSTYINIGKSR